MPQVAAMSTYLPSWGSDVERIAGRDDRGVTPAGSKRALLARRKPAEFDIAEVHGFFTDIELIGYECLVFAEPAGAYKSMEAEVTSVGANLPVNRNGGWQANGQPADPAGVHGARLGLAHNTARAREVSTVTILEGPETNGG